MEHILSVKFIYVSSTPYTHRQKVIVHNIFSVCTFVLTVTCQKWNFLLWYHISAQEVLNLGFSG
jgi:hypothetical protein